MTKLPSAARWLSRPLISLLVVALLVVPAWAQNFNDLLGLKKTGPAAAPVTWKVALVPTQAADEWQLQVTAELPPDHYIYSTSGNTGARTQISLKQTTGFSAAEDKFTADHPPKIADEPTFDDDGNEAVQRVEKYYDRVTWTRTFRRTGTSPGVIRGEIKYQVCDKSTCRQPDPYQFSVALAVDGASTAAEETEVTATEVDAPEAGSVTASAPAPAQPGDLSFVHHVGRKGQQKQAAAWKIHVEPRQVRPGDTVSVHVQVNLEKGWHVYALDQGLNAEGFGPLKTVISVGESQWLRPIGRGFTGPAPHEAPSSGFENLLERSHEGRTVWTRQFQVAKDAPAGDLPLEVTVEYQMCNHAGCQPPKEFTVQGDVRIADAPLAEALLLLEDGGVVDAAFQPEKGGPTAAEAPATRAATGDEATLSAPRGLDKAQGLMMFLITAVVAGFAALLTPCVFPMIPITVSFFLKQSEREHHKPITMASVYCLGIMATFTGLGLIMSALFGATQLNQMATNPWLNLVIAGVLIFFGLNLLGLFELRIPSWLLTYTSGQESRGGFIGVLFMALTFTLTSFTCTFAFAGFLLVQAANGEMLWPILGLLAFSAAFSMPFFFLALFPSLLQKLPKSGGWMNVVKVVMGLVELGAAFKFLSVADQIWNPIPWVFDYELVVSAWMIISITGGLYLLGLFRLSHDTPTEHISVVRLISAMSFLGLAGYLAVGLFAPAKPTGKIWENIQAFAPPRFEDVPHAGGSTAYAAAPATDQDVDGPFLVHGGLKYALDVEEALKFAARENRPVFLDFTGVTCTNCRLMEKGPMSQPHVRDKLSQFVRVQLFTDRVPKVNDPAEAQRLVELNRKLQEAWYGDVTLPAYAIVPPDPAILNDRNAILASFIGMEQVDGTFARFLDDGFSKWKATAQRPGPSLIGQR